MKKPFWSEPNTRENFDRWSSITSLLEFGIYWKIFSRIFSYFGDIQLQAEVFQNIVSHLSIKSSQSIYVFILKYELRFYFKRSCSNLKILNDYSKQFEIRVYDILQVFDFRFTLVT